MNGVTNITEKILGDARAWAQQQLDEGRAEAEAVAREYAEAAASESEAILAEAKERSVAIDERSRSQAEMDRRKMLLAARQESISKAFDTALHSMAELPDEDRALLMVRLVTKYQTEDAELIFNRKDQETVGPLVVSTVNAIYTREQIKETFSGKILDQIRKLVKDQPVKQKVSLSAKVGNFAGGVILKQGDVEHNCTFEVLVNAVRDELEGDVSSILFQ